MTTTVRTSKAPQSSSSSELSSVTDSQKKSGIKRPSQLPDKTCKRPKLSEAKGTYCHQCHGKCIAEDYLRCTRLKSFAKSQPVRACNIAWCSKDLARKYDIDVQAVKARGPKGSKGHDSSKGYEFSCPCCTDSCLCAQCRKKKGLEPLGNKSVPGSQPRKSKLPDGAMPPLPSTLPSSVKHENQPGSPVKAAAFPKLSDVKQNDSSTFLDDSDSELSDPPPATTKTKGKAKATRSVLSGTESKPLRPKKTNEKASKKVKAKAKQETKGKKSAPTADGTNKSTSKKSVKKPVDPPIFEKIDTRLSRVEAEDRMGLREFLYRFRSFLSIPERNLSVLDDFDRPLTESSVRIFAGAMLDPIKHDLEEDVEDPYNIQEDLFDLREELRYYADLVRFASIFNHLKSPLGLRLPRPDPSRSSDEAKVRALLDLDPTQPTPSWAIDGPARRSASKTPTSAEVVHMLLALADRALQTRLLRTEIESVAGESDARKVYATATKQENAAWEQQKKKLAETKVLCKTATESKNNQKKFMTAQHQHNMQIALENVNLRASIQAHRHEPLGTDACDRIYYALTHRSIHDNPKAPVGWASGLLIWGPVPSTTSDDTLSREIPRWSHFGTSQSVKTLIKWLAWKNETVSKPRHTLQKSTVEVIIPQRTRRASSESDGSALSSVPDNDLLEHLHPIGFRPTIEKLSMEAVDLNRKLEEVAEWLKVLEWKGLGERV